MPWKTLLTIAMFGGLVFLPGWIPALNNHRWVSRLDIAAVWQLGLPKVSADSGRAIEEIRAARLELMAPKNLVDRHRDLDVFYASLLRGPVTRILHYGDSPTTGDLITADARALLQKQFGDAGAGFVFIARPWAWYYHRGVDLDAANWKIDVAGVGDIKDGLHGLGGASFRGTTDAVAHWTLKEAAGRVDVAFLAQPGGGSFALEANGVEIGSAGTSIGGTGSDEMAPGFISFDLPAGSRKITLRITDGQVRLYGVEFRKKSAGVIYSSLGINGANITVLSRSFNGAHWAAELQHYNPSLVVLAYGTNESGYPRFVETTWAKELSLAVRRLQAALPDASILLMSPMDRGVKNDLGEIETVPALPRLVEIEARVAEETGVAFFNTFEAMGGEGTMARWYSAQPRLVGADFIHPLPAGAKIVGELLYNALRDGYNEYKLRQLNQRASGEDRASARTSSRPSR